MAQAQTTEGATEIIDAVRFSFLTDEEVRKHSFLKVTNPILLDTVDRPMPSGLYDPILGPLDERVPCKTCGQLRLNCPGHCGHIELVYPVYNPLLFNFLHNLLQKTCFFCHHFKADRSEVESCVSRLKLIIKGDVVGAKELSSDSPSVSSYSEDSDWSHETCSTVLSGAPDQDAGQSKFQQWTSLQYTEANAVLNKFLKLKTSKCKRCKARNPSVGKPTFGWFHMACMSGASIRANVIRGHEMGDPLGSVEDANDINPRGETPDGVSYGAEDGATKKSGRKSGKVHVDFMKQKSNFSRHLLPTEVKEIMKLLWQNEFEICSFISDLQQHGFEKKVDYSMFFLESVLVPPTKFRTPTKGGDSVMEHPQTVLLSKVLQSNISLGNACANNIEQSKIVSRWMDLQQSINILFDSKTAAGQGQRDMGTGICQLLEKKEGLFRQKMMGKRVNFACRSVISPDPYLAVNEIGIPPCFALKLTYPERVTPWNVGKLREAIINGPEIHPGATHYIDKFITMRLPPNRRMRIAMSRKLPASKGALVQSGKSSDNELEGKIVYRHLQDGDVVLVNRQPTLHKPSIMAHVVRVLKGEKTIRMHYANCSTYNADFDGDEMNVHFPQDEISRSEAYNIVNANNQYVRPSSGEPLRALIQDHIVSAALLTKKDTFLNREEFNQLLYSSGVSVVGLGSFSGKPGKKVSIWSSEEEMFPILPVIWKPEPLWTGKQVITAVLNHITKGYPPFTVEKAGKTPRDFFKSKSIENLMSKRKRSNKDKLMKKKQNSEHVISKEKERDEKKSENFVDDEEKLLIYKNDFVRGVIDKAQFADYGLVHTVQELYGSNTAGLLLSALSRLFTVFLQMHGFTCGVDDLLIKKDKDDGRTKQLDECDQCGEKVLCKALGIKSDAKIDPKGLKSKIERIICSDGDAALTSLDRSIVNELNQCTSKGIMNDLLSEGLLKPTGKNWISLMTTSGAKGSKVNFQQISSHLGQQELEGKRVPRMVSGKTLPCFHPWDWAPRAGGFISDRFLTGLRPQEYYFHCMAGREGLVDTAVKTSRSGYLQRCLIKNLESLKINYDYTVRDADGSIIQFQYGEDGVDVHRTSFIAKFKELTANRDMILKGYDQGMTVDILNHYITELPSALKKKAEKFVEELPFKERVALNLVKQEELLKLLKPKFLSSLAQPGEPVGVLAAQSVGEPSTQMTLNTFHLAGRGEMNVTLGIPRLQEILMTASSDLKTPIMTCPLQEGKTKEDANRLADRLRKITVADIIDKMEVSVVPFAIHDDQICSIHKLKMKLYKPEHYPKYTDISVEDWEDILQVLYLRELEDAIQNHLVLLSRISGIKNFVQDSRSKASNGTDENISVSESQHVEDDNDSGDDDGQDVEDLGLDAQKRRKQTTDEMDYEDDGSEEEMNEELSHVRTEGDNSDIENEDEIEISKNDIFESQDGKDEVSRCPIQPRKPSKEEAFGSPKSEKSSKSKSPAEKSKSETKRKKKIKAKFFKKETDRAVFVEATGLDFEVHFKFVNEPHILLAQIAQKAAKKVYIQNSGRIERCQVADCSDGQVIYYGKDPKERKDVKTEDKKLIPALSAAGIDFIAFWQMQDQLDVRYIYCNSVHDMLNTYGVEAARETIIREISHVFKSYGISVNIRHLTLIADYMTHSGGYRPMSRLGGIAESTSPFAKMSFETASKFILHASQYGEVDNLDTPSARICLGLPVKMGTGCFNLMQKVEV